MHLLTNPLFDSLKDAQSILLAGAGGGFDIYSGLPLYFALREPQSTTDTVSTLNAAEAINGG